MLHHVTHYMRSLYRVTVLEPDEDGYYSEHDVLVQAYSSIDAMAAVETFTPSGAVIVGTSPCSPPIQ